MNESKSISDYFDQVQIIVNQMRNNSEKAYYQRILESIKRFIKAEFDYVVLVIEEGKFFFSLMVEGSMSLLCTNEQLMKQNINFTNS